MTKSNAKKSNPKPKLPGRAPRSRGIAKRARRSRKGRNNSAVSTIVKHGLNAFSQVHVPLPVSTGAYTVVRCRKTFSSSSNLALVGPMAYDDSYVNGPNWSQQCGLLLQSPTGTGLLTSSFSRINMPYPFDDGGGFIEVAPAACSLQVMCPASLVNAAGVVHIGRLKTTLSQPKDGDTRTVQQFADALLSYCNPKTITGAKLAMTPQQVNCIPSNITELQQFAEMTAGFVGNGTWGTAEDFQGFKPAFVYNPGGVELTYTVCVEWRVRLSPFNPMHSSQTSYQPTNPSIWHQIVSTAENSNAVEDVGIAGAAGYLATGGGEGFMGGALDWLSTAAMSALPELEAALPLLAI